MKNVNKKSYTNINKCEQWMAQLPEKLLDVPLYYLSVPGSHDSMSYCLDKTSPLDPQLPVTLSIFEKFVPCITRTIILRWSTTQTLSVAEQLNAGIRYLDLRIGHRPGDPTTALYFVHGFFTSLTVKGIFLEISAWLHTHPMEVLILDCRITQEFTPELHLHLISCINSIFGYRLCPNHEVPTLRRMWKMGYQVILSYDATIAHKYHYLWPSIPYWWADTTRTSKLIQYLEKKKQKGRPVGFFVAGLNLTEDTLYIVTHPFGSLKKLTLPKLPILYFWVQKQCPGEYRDSTNIVAEDLIGSDCFVSAVINLNSKLVWEKQHLD
ncbi:hypothetical protein GDO86_009113 [Hymenochirus boettgeri]|uniref:Phosphatidylinositol-specific phospholipase C X domain-containing protein n=1 Tax=Hymenochirus boettgeri TaxID=247094 RepID=A0A8T2J5X7_9PIPI|nr:hypothetical protein GDO86_005786 [Hymenochirus boettgeri]KAG8443803.1 hypothetical protein GDO86_009113 [Hymenochirus boettgeri]